MRRNYNWVQVRRRGEWVDNDEGYNYRYCPCCARTTEHDLDKCKEVMKQFDAPSIGKIKEKDYAAVIQACEDLCLE